MSKCCGDGSDVAYPSTVDSIVTYCGGCNRPTTSCGCALNTTCKPYTANVSLCPQDNKKVIYLEKVSGALKASQSFCMPVCGGNVRVVFQNVVDIAIGSWLWAYAIGYLKVVSYDSATNTIELQNPCPQNGCGTQAPPGSPIPACQVFVVTVPPCDSSSGGPSSFTPFLDSGFTAPEDGLCIDIAVTNVNGLAVGNNVSINNGIYRISAIKSATLITICNDGEGLTPGTVVNYQDSAGNLIVPIVTINANPCLTIPSNSGSVLVCDSNVTKPITGSLAGQILVLNDPVTGEASYRSLGLPVLDCTSLTVTLTLDPALPPSTPYLVQVVSTADFTVGELLTITGTQFTVDSISDATHLYLIPIVAPVAIVNYPVGSTLCSAACCEQIVASLQQIAGSDTQSLAAPEVILLGETHAGPLSTLTMTNPSPIYTMIVFFSADWFFRYAIIGTAADTAEVNMDAYASFDPSPANPISILYAMKEASIVSATIGNYHSEVASRTGVAILAPGGSYTLKAQANVKFHAGTADNVTADALNSHITYIGIAVEA